MEGGLSGAKMERSNKRIAQEPQLKNMNIKEETKGLTVEIVSDPELVVAHETARVRWYLKEYARYKSLGYDSILRFPPGIDPANIENLSDEEVKTAVEKDYGANQADYAAEARNLRETWGAIAEKILPVVASVYGFTPSYHFKLVPTAYGTGGGALEKGGVIFFKLPKYRPAHGRTEAEAIVHEVLNHEATGELREGTSIDDSIFTTHQWHKERLMDLLGRTLLVRSGLMKRENVVMDDYATEQAADVIDTLYYTDTDTPDESKLRYEGKLPDLVRAIEEKIKETESTKAQ